MIHPSGGWPRSLPADARLLFLSRAVRLFGYGLISVILALYLAQLGLSGPKIGLLLTLTLVGDTVISLWITTTADRAGRKKMLLVGALLVVAAGVVFALTRDYLLLVAAATLGVISPSGNEVGPFLSIEQAALSHIVPAGQRTAVFAWYHLAGSLATAGGALVGGGAVDLLQWSGWTPLGSFRAVIVGYAVVGVALAALFAGLSGAVEAAPGARVVGTPVLFGLHASRGIVFRLSSLFALDAFGGGLVVQSIAVYWFHLRFGINAAALGAIFFGANVLAGCSAVAAVPMARRVGLIRTMVYTHVPSNILLMMVPLMPTLSLAVTMLLLRFSISQMDVPTRQSYLMAVVTPGERAAASGVTSVARTAGAAASPWLAGVLVSIPAVAGSPFLLAGGLKLIYDWLIWRGFRAVHPPEEDATP